MNYRIILLLLIFSIVFLNCSKSSETNFPELTFQVNADLLDRVVTFNELQFELGIPKDFISLPDSQITLLQDQIRDLSEGRTPKYTPVHVFSERSGKGILIISLISKSTLSFLDFIRSYNSFYQEFYPESETSKFSYKKINFWQGRRVDLKKNVYFRFVFDLNLPKNNIQIEYVFPQSVNYGEIVETSIGSINHFTQEIK